MWRDKNKCHVLTPLLKRLKKGSRLTIVTDSTDYRPNIWTESTTYLVTTQQANDLVTLAA